MSQREAQLESALRQLSSDAMLLMGFTQECDKALGRDGNPAVVRHTLQSIEAAEILMGTLKPNEAEGLARLRASMKAMRMIAYEALDLAHRCHGGHSYESSRSQEAHKCCEVRMVLDELREKYLHEAEQQQSAGF